MKKTILAIFAMAAVTCGTTSCSQSDESNPSSQDGNSLVITISDGTSRSVDGQVAGGVATALSQVDGGVEVFALSAGGSVIKEYPFSTLEIGNRSKTIEQVSSSVTKVVVVANVPAGELTAVRALTSYNALCQYAFLAANQNGTTGANNKTMMGEGTPVAGSPAADGHDFKTVTVALKPITARFEIGTVVPGKGIATINLLGVWMNNVYKDASMATTSLMFNNNQSALWTLPSAPGTSSTPYGTITVPTYPAPFYTAANASVTTAAGASVYAFHVFAGPVIGTGAGLGTTTIPHVILLISGQFKDPDLDGTYYYTGTNKYFLSWVTYTKYNDGSDITTILPNTIYKMGVRAADGSGTPGLTIDAEVIGVNPPETPKFDLGVNVSVTAWTAKEVTPSVI